MKLTDFLWTKGVEMPHFPRLSGDASTDVLIIGGGMAGILCAMELEARGVDYMLVEGAEIGGGVTRGTTAVLTAQHDSLYQDMIARFGAERARLYLNANLDAVERFAELSRRISCDFQRKPSAMYARHDKKLMQREIKALAELGYRARFAERTALPFAVAGAVIYPGMAQFHPLKFIAGISRGLNIYERTFVSALDGTTAVTRSGKIRAHKVIVATHFPFINSHGLYFMKLYQRRSYVVALENAPDLGCTIEDSDKNGFYFRNHGELLLIGGGGGRTGHEKGGIDEVRKFARACFPMARERHAWADQDCVSLDGVPYIGRYSRALDDVYVASGFNLWGMTTSMTAAGLLADMVTGRENEYERVFKPRRNMLTGQLLANIGTTAASFVTPTRRRCTHLGCALKWNPAEHSWDCSCHGSRFGENGKVLNEPAMRGIDPGK